MKNSRARYTCACAALLAMPVAFALTLWLASPSEPDSSSASPSYCPSHSRTSSHPFPRRHPGPPTPANWWITGVTLLYAYRAIGWLAAQRLRRHGVCAAPADWQHRVTKLSNRIRQTRPVLLLESALAETPLTIGLWRPVILMPLGLLAGLPTEQVEAILLHELAHIRRHDYLVNLLQAAVEGLLFYHPATWWVSHVIRREREMCCDDLVVSATGDTLAYTHALAAIEEHRVRVPILAATGGPLMTRIQRLLGQPSRLSSAPALIFLALATGAALFAFQPEPLPLPDPIPAPSPVPDPTPAPDPAPQTTPSPQAPGSEDTSLIERFLARDKTPYDKWLNQEVARIITADERTAFRGLATDDERQQFIEQFWLRRDPTPDTPANEFREEYYRRIAWSNDRFTEPAHRVGRQTAE